jgi:hypothetical protein
MTVLERAEEPVEDFGSLGLSVGGGVVALAQEHGLELGPGVEVDTGLAGRLEGAVELAVPVLIATRPYTGLAPLQQLCADFDHPCGDERLERYNAFGDIAVRNSRSARRSISTA